MDAFLNRILRNVLRYLFRKYTQKYITSSHLAMSELLGELKEITDVRMKILQTNSFV